MSEQPQPGPAGPEHVTGDFGRRVEARRKQLGLSRDEIAHRAGSAPGYITYVEEQSATPGIGFMLRLADALGTSLEELSGATVDLPPGTGQAAYHPELLTLDREECWALLGTHGVGRVGVATGEGPAIVPVNYVVNDGSVAFRTAAGALPARTVDHEIAFEVDRIDEAFSRGWSVLVVGRAREVTDPAAQRVLTERAPTEPWAGGDRHLWISVQASRVTGRRIFVRDAPA
ncbi:helix-turn-helix domain-containing protein [Streptomyces finlayi]|uniref:Helix-turn-helix domain-containing protein n=1 Tax=Streptomyces finlayi TaxID=67296 RepID=A0A7G7BDG4_9ACTN|nr:pyridoxamine 5'-phosphate oxidase family protein [Streptomyces finlayi]QNE73379.1 helix-turn-helix domain-containing protein [Streptomyces finlayi]